MNTVRINHWLVVGLCLCACLLPLGGNAAPGYKVAADSVTNGTVVVEGHSINYKAIAGNIVLTDDSGTSLAQMFYVAYLKDPEQNAVRRPITFFYNGGPGSSSVFLHMGAFGPRRVTVTDHERTPPAPYSLVNNSYSLLDATDMVFIDAPSTGFSRIISKKLGGAGTPADFYGVDEDANAFAKFIVTFLTKYHRWNSPKFLFGESYGTTRTAVLGQILQQKYSIDLNGIVFLSAILDFTTSTDNADFTPSIDLPYILGLPSLAASAWYHKKLDDRYPDLQKLLTEVQQFSTGPYAQALLAGSTLGQAQFAQIAAQMSQYTGLPAEYIEKSDLRVTARRFEAELLRNSGDVLGRLDARYVGPAMDPLDEAATYDPTSASMRSAIVSSFNTYVHQSLKYQTPLYYRPSYPVQPSWDWQHQPPGFGKHTRVIPDRAIDLASQMKYDPKLKVMLNAGYYDLATPYFAAVYVMQHLQIPRALQNNITYDFYQSGHMVYLHIPALQKLHDNVASFIKGATAEGASNQ